MIRTGCKRLSLEAVSEIFHSVESIDTTALRYGISEAQVARIKRCGDSLHTLNIYGDALTASGL
jgi:hypothetical protein